MPRKYLQRQGSCPQYLRLPVLLHLAVIAIVAQSACGQVAKLGSRVIDNSGVLLSTAPGVARERLLYPITIELLDSNDVLDEGATATVSVVVQGAQISGRTSLTAQNGLAVFSDLIIDIPGEHPLQFSVPDFATITPRVLIASIQAGFQARI
jgi:hypothetical protein